MKADSAMWSQASVSIDMPREIMRVKILLDQDIFNVRVPGGVL
jgi:hypothetical protein